MLGHIAMNNSLLTADRRTHVKIVVVSLIAAIVVVWVGITAHLARVETAAGVQTNGPVLKAGKLRTYTNRDSQLIR
jgi:hypothetical protein